MSSEYTSNTSSKEKQNKEGGSKDRIERVEDELQMECDVDSISKSEFGTSLKDEVEAPKEGMAFESELQVKIFYNTYAQNQGFGIAKKSTKCGEDGKQKYFSFVCARNGKFVSVSNNSLHPKPSTKTGCKAKINVTVRDDGRCVITRVYLNHNHELLSPGKTRHLRCNKVIDSHVKKKLELNDKSGIPLNKSFHSLVVEAGGYENLSFGEKECINYIAKARELRLGVGDAEALSTYFQRMQTRNSDFFYSIDIDDDGRIRNVFWADARCRYAYDYFGDVVTFDTTYLTNTYDMPFAPFVGVNHHGQSILFGCGLLSSESTDTFVWLFKVWLTCMMGNSPKAIITDQCNAMQIAIAKVFPHSRHRLCLWHIMKKIPAKLGGLANYKKVKRLLKSLVYDSTKSDEFESNWKNMIKEYKLEKNEWLNSLYEIRHRWVPLYVKDNFWGGISMTQRSESMNAFFDGYVHSKTTLKQFVEQYDYALKNKVEKEKNADFASMNSIIPPITSLSLEKQFQNTYTNDMFRKFQEELRGLMFCNASFISESGPILLYEVKENVLVEEGNYWKESTYEVFFERVKCEVQCLCRLFEFKGIVCRHAVSVLIINKVNEVPSYYLLDRWRKDVKRRYTSINHIYDNFDDTGQIQRHKKLSPRLIRVGQLGEESDGKCDLLCNILDQAEMQLLEVKSDNIHEKRELGHSGRKLQSPLKIRTVGRPAFKRKEAKVDQIIKKSKTKVMQRKKNSHEKKNGKVVSMVDPGINIQSSNNIGAEGSAPGTEQILDAAGQYSELPRPAAPL